MAIPRPESGLENGFGKGRYISQGHLIELATAENHYPDKGRWYIASVWRDGKTMSFVTLQAAMHVVGALNANGAIVTRVCSCGHIVTGRPRRCKQTMDRHRGKCPTSTGYTVLGDAQLGLKT